MEHKVLLVAMALALLPLAAHGQKKDIALGIDRDTLLYNIASPGDNWWIHLAGGVQTFIGNEQDGAARWNKVNGGAHVEVGKWLIPDVAVSLRLSAFHVSSQGCDSLGNPWLDMEQYTHDTYFGGLYHPMSIHGLTAMGIVTLDWTNLFKGYERGRRLRPHLQTPLGIGGIWLYGSQRNAAAVSGQLGKMRWSSNVAFMTGLRVECALSPNIALHSSVELLATSGTIDRTDHNSYANPPHPNRVIDWIPSLNIGVTINLKNPKPNHGEKHGFAPIALRRTTWLDTLVICDTIELLHPRHTNNTPCEYCAHVSYLRRLEYDMKNLMPSGCSPNAPAVLGTVIYFDRGGSVIDLNGQMNLAWLAGQVAMCHDTTEFYVIGMADTASGSAESNRVLSERRCEAVRDALVKKYGIEDCRLAIVPLGGFAMHPEPDRNRCVIVVIKTEDTQAIVSKWLEKQKKSVR